MPQGVWVQVPPLAPFVRREKYESIKRQIKRFKGHIPIAVKIVDNEDLEQVLWDNKDI